MSTVRVTQLSVSLDGYATGEGQSEQTPMGHAGTRLQGKFGPQTGPWADHEWRGWWGPEPPFHTPVVVLTHHPRPTLEMAGGTVFHFVDAGPAAALERARGLAGGRDVRTGGGPSTVRQFLSAGLVDRMHVAVVPILLGRGVSIWAGLEGLEDDYDVESVVSPTSGVTHLTLSRRH